MERRAFASGEIVFFLGDVDTAQKVVEIRVRIVRRDRGRRAFERLVMALKHE